MASIKPNEAYTPAFTGAYANFLHEGQENDNGVMVYSVRAVFDEFDGWDPKDSESIPKWARDAVEAAKEIGRTKKWGGKIPRALEYPFNDGNTKDSDEFHDTMYMSLKSYKNRPPIIDPSGKAMMQIDDSTIYSGAVYRALVAFAPFEHKGKRGIGAYITAIQKVKDGERKSGGMSEAQAEQMFDAVGDTSDAEHDPLFDD